jgi:hypothetical protein
MKKKRLLILTVVLLTLLSVWQVNLVSGSDEPPTGEPGTITVHKFHDVNRNGVQDAGEEDIEGWLIRLWRYDENTGGFDPVGEGYTDSDGEVTFSGLVPAKYKVWEEKRECWEPTTPPLGTYLWEWNGGYATYVYPSWFPDIVVEFGNVDNCVPPPPDGQGCTPGFWKNKKRLPLWPLDPDADFDTTFGVDLFDPDITLGEAVRAKGGGDNKLARHGTAALLNAAHPDVDYPLTEAEVIAAVQAGDADTLVGYNELLAPGFCD